MISLKENLLTLASEMGKQKELIEYLMGKGVAYMSDYDDRTPI